MLVKQLWKQPQKLQQQPIETKMSKHNSVKSKNGKRLLRLVQKGQIIQRKEGQNKKNSLSLTQQNEQLFATAPKLPQFLIKDTQKQTNFRDKKIQKKQMKSKEQIQLEKTIKLKELYSKKADLLHKLKILNRQARIKTVPFADDIKKSSNSQLISQKDAKEPFLDSSSRYLPIRRGSRLSSLDNNFQRPGIVEPVSIVSVQHNRKVLKFIEKAHQQTVKRDINRIQQFHLLLKSRLQGDIQQKVQKSQNASYPNQKLD